MILSLIRKLATLCFIGGFAAHFAAQAAAPAPLSETLAHEAQLSTFNRLIIEAGLQDELRAAGPLTVFAPTDEAFKAVPAKTLDSLQADKEQLKAVLRFHILAAKLNAADIKPGASATLQGASLTLARAGEFVTVEEAMVQRADVAASNGVVHVIDRVLLPPKK